MNEIKAPRQQILVILCTLSLLLESFSIFALPGVYLAEGKVSIFPYDYDNQLEITSGKFIQFTDNNVIEVLVNGSINNAYLDESKRNEFGNALQPGVYLLLVLYNQSDIQWEVLDIETVLSAGKMFVGNKISEMTLASRLKIISETYVSSLFKNSSAGVFNQTKHSFATTNLLTPENNKLPTQDDFIPKAPESGKLSVVPKASPSNGDAPLNVSFDASGSSASGGLTISKYSWDFDFSDGIQEDATGIRASHTYNLDGNYTVTLTITDNLGQSASGTVMVSVGDPVSLTDIYVSSSTGDDSNSGSELYPLKTITHAMTHVDGINLATIHLADGTYSSVTGEVFPITCTDNVILRGESNNTIIDGNGANLFVVNNLFNFQVDNFTIENAATYFNIDSSTFILNNCSLRNSLGTSECVVLDGSNVTFRNSTWEDVRSPIYAPNGTAPSSVVIDHCEFINSIWSYSIWINSTGSSVTITNSSFHDRWKVILWAMHNNITISHCSFYNSIDNATGYPAGINILGVTNEFNINNCLIYNCSGESIALYISDPNHARIYNMTFANNPGHEAIRIGSVPTSCVINNCCFTNNLYGITFNAGAVDPNLFTIENNLFFGNITAHIYDVDGPVSFNTQVAINGLGNASNNIVADPEYKDAGAGDFRPNFAATSPLIDAGIDDANTPSTDYDENPRPIDGDGVPGARSDIGAYEYQGGGSDPVISGRIFDSATGVTVNDAIIGLYRKNKKEPETVQSAGNYSFNVMPGVYYLIVRKAGYRFPSKEATAIEAQGKYFEVVDGKDVNVDIPLDSGIWLELERTANKKELQIGDIVTVNSAIKNRYFFDSVNSVKLKESIPAGLKYIKGSCRLNGAEHEDPEGNWQNIFFNIGSVFPKQTINLSYQMLVNTGAAYAKVKSDGVCVHNNSEISDKKILSFEVIPDTLFYTGTVIGRIKIVGREQASSAPLEGIELITEYGLKIKTDKYGKFHIPDVRPGRHVLKVNPKSLPEENEAGKPVLFDVRQGGLTNVKVTIRNRIQRSEFISNNQDEEEELVSVHEEDLTTKTAKFPNKEDSLFIVAMGEIEIGNNKVSGNKFLPGEEDEFKEGAYVKGKGSVYVEGEKKGYKIIGSVDTDRLKDGNKSLQEQKLYTRLPDENFSPEYGDQAELDYKNTETQDFLFLKVEKDGNYAKWGTLDVDYPYYRRVFHGGEFKYVGRRGMPEIQAYWAGTNNRVAYEEFNGTGGSVYYLKNDWVIEGSEKIVIQMKETLTQRIVMEVPLSSVDYQIFYEQGRVVLNKPLSTYISEYSQEVIQSNIQAGNFAMLGVYYEYRSLLPINGEAYGGRVSQTLFDKLIVSGQFVEETSGERPYKMPFGEVKYLIDNDSWIRVQFGHSEGGFMYTQSYDGGMSFFSTNTGADDSGNMFLAEAKGRLLNNLKGGLLYSKQGAGFSALSSSKTNGQEKCYGELEYLLNEEMELSFSHFIQETDSDSHFAIRGDSEKLQITKAGYDWRGDSFDLRLEYQIQEIESSLYSRWVNGQYYPGAKELAGLRTGWQATSNMHLYGGLQETIRGLDNDQYFAGGHISVFGKAALNLEGRTGDIGDSVSFGIAHEGEDNSRNSFSLTSSNSGYSSESGNPGFNPHGFGSNTSIDISRSRETDKDSRYQFSNKLNFNNGMHGFAQGIFSENKTAGILWGAGYESASFLPNEAISALDRESASLWYRLPRPNFENYGKAEWREDSQNDIVQTRAWYFEQGFKLKQEEGWSFTGRGGLGYAENPVTHTDRFDFTDLFIGVAYRPPQYVSLNLLGKYIYLSDLFPDGREVSFVEDSKTKKHIFSTGFVWDVNDSLQLMENIAFRKLCDKTGNRDWQESQTYLWINGLSYKFYEEWKVNLEYRVLENTTSEDKKQGYLAELFIPVKDVLYFGVGYNFTSFDDDLSNEDDYDVSGFFVRMTGVI